LTYVIDSRTDVSHRSKLDGMRITDDELLSRESHMTFQTFIDEDKTSVSLKQSITTCSSNVETSGVGQAECETFRISKSCEDEQRNFDTVIDKARYDTVAGTSRCHSSLAEAENRDNDEESFVSETFSSFEVST